MPSSCSALAQLLHTQQPSWGQAGAEAAQPAKEGSKQVLPWPPAQQFNMAPDQPLLTARKQDQDRFLSSISKDGWFPLTPEPVHVSQLVTGACSSLSCHQAPVQWHGASHPPGFGFHVERWIMEERLKHARNWVFMVKMIFNYYLKSKGEKMLPRMGGFGVTSFSQLFFSNNNEGLLSILLCHIIQK